MKKVILRMILVLSMVLGVMFAANFSTATAATYPATVTPQANYVDLGVLGDNAPSGTYGVYITHDYYGNLTVHNLPKVDSSKRSTNDWRYYLQLTNNANVALPTVTTPMGGNSTKKTISNSCKVLFYGTNGGTASANLNTTEGIATSTINYKYV